MKKTDFIKILNEKNIAFVIDKKGKFIITNDNYNAYLGFLTTLPEGTTFNNDGDVDLESLKSLPEGTKFNNGGWVDLRSLKSLPEGTVFNNGEYVMLISLKSIPKMKHFKNRGTIYLNKKLEKKPNRIEFI